MSYMMQGVLLGPGKQRTYQPLSGQVLCLLLAPLRMLSRSVWSLPVRSGIETLGCACPALPPPDGVEKLRLHLLLSETVMHTHLDVPNDEAPTKE
jgi:hypothetical protein